MQTRLLEILKDKGLRRLPEPIQLASGEWSQDFIDEGSAWLLPRSRNRLQGDRQLSFRTGIEFDRWAASLLVPTR